MSLEEIGCGRDHRLESASATRSLTIEHSAQPEQTGSLGWTKVERLGVAD